MRMIYYDTETTGTRPDKDRIVEIAAYDPALNKNFCMLVQPGCPIPAEASAISHITDEMVKDAPSFQQVGALFAEFCTGDTVLVAHNNDNFDRPFLENEFARSGLAFPAWKFIDTLKWSRKYRSDLPRHSLQFLREAYGIESNQAHRALDDVMVLYKVFSRMTDDLGSHVILDLLSRAGEADHSRMPFGKYQGKPLSDVPKDYVQWLAKNGALDKKENAPLKQAFEKLGHRI